MLHYTMAQPEASKSCEKSKSMNNFGPTSQIATPLAAVPKHSRNKLEIERWHTGMQFNWNVLRSAPQVITNKLLYKSKRKTKTA